MRKITLLLFLFPLFAHGQATYTITAGEWAAPHDGEALVHMSQFADAARELEGHPDGHLQILYPGGDAGSLWAREVSAWFVALGIGSKRIELIPGSSRGDAIELRVARDAQQAELSTRSMP
jgi:hypothetical protein